MAPGDCKLVGRWRIVEADIWDRDYLEPLRAAMSGFGKRNERRACTLTFTDRSGVAAQRSALCYFSLNTVPRKSRTALSVAAVASAE
jgi:hypothetical protein